MASRRGFKKDLNYIYSDLLLDAFKTYSISEKKDEQKASALCKKITDSFTEFIKRSNHTDGKDNPKIVKAYYKKLWEEVLKDVMSLPNEIEGL